MFSYLTWPDIHQSESLVGPRHPVVMATQDCYFLFPNQHRRPTLPSNTVWDCLPSGLDTCLWYGRRLGLNRYYIATLCLYFVRSIGRWKLGCHKHWPDLSWKIGVYRLNPLTPTTVAIWVQLRAERQSARMSKIINDSLTRSGTGCSSCTHVATVGVKGLIRVVLWFVFVRLPTFFYICDNFIWHGFKMCWLLHVCHWPRS